MSISTPLLVSHFPFSLLPTLPSQAQAQAQAQAHCLKHSNSPQTIWSSWGPECATGAISSPSFGTQLISRTMLKIFHLTTSVAHIVTHIRGKRNPSKGTWVKRGYDERWGDEAFYLPAMQFATDPPPLVWRPEGLEGVPGYCLFQLRLRLRLRPRLRLGLASSRSRLYRWISYDSSSHQHLED